MTVTITWQYGCVAIFDDGLKQFEIDRHRYYNNSRFCLQLSRTSRSRLWWLTPRNRLRVCSSAYDWIGQPRAYMQLDKNSKTENKRPCRLPPLPFSWFLLWVAMRCCLCDEGLSGLPESIEPPQRQPVRLQYGPRLQKMYWRVACDDALRLSQ